MAKFIVTKREVWTSAHRVEASKKEEAIWLVSRNENEEIDGGLEYSHDLSIDNWTVEIEE